MSELLNRPWHTLAASMICLVARFAQGDVYETTDKDVWIAAVGSHATADFTGFPAGTIITGQYADLGVVFSDGNDCIYPNPNSFPNDGVGLDGNGDITVVFAQLQNWLAVDQPGFFGMQLLRNGQVVHTSGTYHAFSDGSFLGLISSEGFDAAVLIELDEAEIDDLYFGPPVCPADLDGDGTVAIADLLGLLGAWGSQPPGPPDLDGDGDVDIVDFLDLLLSWGPCPAPPDCNGNGSFDFADIVEGASPDCNANAIPDECDVAGGSSPDLLGDGIPDECQPPENDDCEDASAIGEGDTLVYTVGATTAGWDAPCGVVYQSDGDIWFLYTPSCTGTATFSLCGSADFDTHLAIYYGACPPPNPLACNDDAPGCGQASVVEQVVAQGFPYLVRVGGKEGGGLGVLTISCRPFAPGP
jgi:hypothetical protein